MTPEPAHPYPLREFERVTCFRLRILTGQGKPDDPVRHVTYWLTEEGDEIARIDEWADTRDLDNEIVMAAVES